MTANENFHLVKRVMSVKATVNNQRPRAFSHMHNTYKDSKVSSQQIFKKYENDRENKVLLKKML